jgi:hypothetical protein
MSPLPTRIYRQDAGKNRGEGSVPVSIIAVSAYGAGRSRPGSRCVRKRMEESPGFTGHGAR